MHLTPGEVDALISAAKANNRYGQRDALIIRMAARHGFRVTELANLRWSDVDLRTGRLLVRRLKGRDLIDAHAQRRRIARFAGVTA